MNAQHLKVERITAIAKGDSYISGEFEHVKDCDFCKGAIEMEHEYHYPPGVMIRMLRGCGCLLFYFIHCLLCLVLRDKYDYYGARPWRKHDESRS